MIKTPCSGNDEVMIGTGCNGIDDVDAAEVTQLMWLLCRCRTSEESKMRERSCVSGADRV